MSAVTEELRRIGRGVPGARQPRRKASNWIVAAAVLIAIGILGTVSLLQNPIGGQAQPTAPPTSATTTVDAKGACAVLVPVLSAGADQVLLLATSPDGSTVNWAKVDSTISNLEAVQHIVPAEMKQDLQTQIDLFVELKQRHEGVLGGSARIDFTEFRASGLRIGARCAEVVD